MARGGYRRPSRPQGPSGPGKQSRRVDANQPKTVPDLDNPDLEYGEVQALAGAQDVAPLPRGIGTLAAQGGPAQQTHPAQRPEALPDFLTQLPSGRAGEPGSAGLSLGPGGGPEMLSTPPEPADTREAVLTYLATGFNNPDAQRMLDEYRAARATPAQPVAPIMTGAPQPGPDTGEPTLPMSGLAAEPPVEPPRPLPTEEQAPTLPPTGEGEEPVVEPPVEGPPVEEPA